MNTTTESRIITNEKGLITFLRSHKIPYEVLQDGWKVRITVNNIEELFRIGKMFGSYLKEHKIES